MSPTKAVTIVKVPKIPAPSPRAITTDRTNARPVLNMFEKNTQALFRNSLRLSGSRRRLRKLFISKRRQRIIRESGQTDQDADSSGFFFSFFRRKRLFFGWSSS
ncbi:MAG: hypothetical protein ACO1G7_07735, partial [Bacteroidota bacterium]